MIRLSGPLGMLRFQYNQARIPSHKWYISEYTFVKIVKASYQLIILKDSIKAGEQFKHPPDHVFEGFFEVRYVRIL
jgi:hypothetical protein